MNAIILSAGQGTRLQPLTNDRPKCLVNLFGKSLLERQIETLQYCGINDISIVTGYMADKIVFSNLEYFENTKYDSTNMVETLFCAKEKLLENTIITYGDIIWQESVLKQLIESQDDISVVVDKNWHRYWEFRFDDPLSDAETLKLDEHNYITDIGQKTNNIEEIQGQYIGLMKFQNNGINALKSFYDSSKQKSKLGMNPLNPKISFENSFMTDLIRGMIKNGNNVKSIPIHGGWLELDSISDYEKYNLAYVNGNISEFFSLQG